MQLKEFVVLDYKEQLRLLNQSGIYQGSFVEEEHKITLYKLFQFYVELTRKLSDLSFENICIMEFDELPAAYHDILKEWWDD